MAPRVPPTRRFVNHPGAKEAPAQALKYEPAVDTNPVLRGWPLVVASTIITSSAWVRKLMWENAKFGQARLEPSLDNELWRLQPDVIPLADGPDSQRMLELDDELRRPQPDDLPGRFLSVADYHGLYSRGEATPLDVVEALLPLIRRDVIPRSPYSVAWLQTDVDAVLAAARASTARWAAGAPLGILDGVPFGVKDDIPVAGFVSTMAIPPQPSEPYFQTPETETAWPVLKLQDAGAILLGKMNQHEIGMDTTGCNSGTGTPQNWYAPSHYPGGSSSGAGSALCAGIVPIAIGTDAGGSCRIPPAFCGVYGLKPTHHRTGTMNSSVCVTAPMAATATDLLIAYRHMSQPNPRDPHQSLFSTSLPHPSPPQNTSPSTPPGSPNPPPPSSPTSTPPSPASPPPTGTPSSPSPSRTSPSPNSPTQQPPSPSPRRTPAPAARPALQITHPCSRPRTASCSASAPKPRRRSTSATASCGR